MKLLLSALLLVFSFSCAHQQPVAQTTPHPRFPASNADSQDITKMTNAQLLGFTGKNVLRVTVACPVSAFTVVATSVAETMPMLSAWASLGTELGTGFKYSTFNGDKTTTNYFGGAPVGVVVDLTKMGYVLLFEDSQDLTEGAFKNAKASYPATKYLAQKFYSTEGNCGLAGRKLVDVLTEIQRRQSLATPQK